MVNRIEAKESVDLIHGINRTFSTGVTMNRYIVTPGSGTLCLSRGRLYVIGEFGGVSASCLLNGALGRDVSRNVSMCSITRLAFSPTLSTYTGYTGFTATWMKYLPHGNRPRCYYRRASTTCRSKFHLLRIYFVLSSFSRIPRILVYLRYTSFRILESLLFISLLKFWGTEIRFNCFKYFRYFTNSSIKL